MTECPPTDLRNEERASIITRYRNYADDIFQATSPNSKVLIVRLMRCTYPDDESDDDVEDDEIGNQGCKQLARPIRESFLQIVHPHLSIYGLNPVVTVSVPHSELKWVLPNSKVLTYNLGI